MGQGEERHLFTIDCGICQKPLTTSCIMDILVYMAEHKNCAKQEKED